MMERSPDVTGRKLAPHSNWSDAGPSEHFVQFYETDDFLLDSVAGFIGTGLAVGDVGIVVATAEHLDGLQARLRTEGVDLDAATASGQYVAIDAADLLSQLTVGGHLDAERFAEILGGIVERAAEGCRHVRIFGEMVALLVAKGNRAEAVQLEEFWNRLQGMCSFSLFCSYPMSDFGDHTPAESLAGVCAEHTRVIPAESYTALTSVDERLRAIAMLQQKAHSLEAEVEELKRTKEALRESEERFKSTFAHAATGMALTDLTGRFLQVNNAFCTITGYTEDELRALDFTSITHPDDRQEKIERVARMLAGEIPSFVIEKRYVRKDGDEVWVQNSVSLLRDAHGAPVNIIVLTENITERKRAEAALNRSIHLRDEFLSAVSHDLKTPLTVLKGQAEILQRRVARGSFDAESVVKGLEQIRSKSRMMAALIDELLDVTRLRAGEELQLDRRPVDLVALVRDAIEGLEEALDKHQVTVAAEETELIGCWDRLRIERVVENLVGNAVKYSPQGGEITVSLSRETCPGDDVAVVAVRDRGLGIAHDDLPRIFERFYRGKNAAGGILGTGLGLAGVRQIVEQHGGTICVESEEGAGSTFIVRLPME